MSTRETVVGQWGAEAMVCEDIYKGFVQIQKVNKRVQTKQPKYQVLRMT